jgi:hypothetical protein
MKVSARPVEPRPHVLPKLRHPARQTAQAGLIPITSGLSCLFADWPGQEPGRSEKLAVDAGDPGLPKPILLASLPLLTGGMRHVVLVGEDAATVERRRIDITLNGLPYAVIDPGWLQSPLRKLPELASGVAAAGKSRLAKLLLTAGAPLFARPDGGSGLREVLALLDAESFARACWHRTGRRSGILSVPVPPALAAKPEAVLLIAGAAARHLKPARVLAERTDDAGWLHLMLPRRPGTGETLAGFAGRPFVICPPEGTALPLAPALARHGPELSAWATAALADAAREDEVSAALLQELRSGTGGRAALRIAQVARTRAGVFLQLEGTLQRPATLRVAVEGRASHLALTPNAPPVAFAALPSPVKPDAVVAVSELHRSGRIELLHHDPVPLFAPETEHLPLAGPALARATLDLAERGDAHSVEIIGEPTSPRPLAVVARFGRDETLRALVASLGVGRGSSPVDLTVLADAGDEADRARRLLSCCHAVFAQPAKLVSVPPDAADAPALATALRVNGNERVLILGRDVLPLGAAWPAAWVRAIRPSSAAPVGGALLAPDGSILHAGGDLDLRTPSARATPDRRGLSAESLPRRSAPRSMLFTADCVGLGRAAVVGFLQASTGCPDASTLLSLLAAEHGGSTRFACRATRYGGAPARATLMEALRPHMLASLLDAKRLGGEKCGS